MPLTSTRDLMLDAQQTPREVSLSRLARSLALLLAVEVVTTATPTSYGTFG